MITEILDNKVSRAIAAVQAKIDDGSISPEALAKADTDCRLQFDEWFAMNDCRALMQASDKISYEISQALYAIFGESLEHFNNCTLSERIIGMKIGTELLGMKIAMSRRR